MMCGLIKENGVFRFSGVVMMMSVSSVVEMIGFTSIAPIIALSTNYEQVMQNEYIKLAHVILGSPDKASFIVYAASISVILLWCVALTTAMSTWMRLSYVKQVNFWLSTKVFASLMHRKIEDFEEDSPALFQQRINYICTRLSSGVLDSLLIFCSRFLQLALLGFLLFLYDSRIAGMAFGVLIAIYIAIYLLIKTSIIENNTEAHEYELDIKRLINSSYLSYRELHIDGRLQGIISEFSSAKGRALLKTKVIELINSLPKIVIEAAGLTLVVVAIALLAIEKESNERITMVIVLALAGYRILPAVQQIFHAASRYIGAVPLIDSLKVILSEGGDPKCHQELDNSNIPGPSIQGMSTITFEMLSYNMRSVGKVFDCISFDFPNEQVIRVKGDSGVGKSIFVEILAGLRVPSSGRVLVRGLDISCIPRDVYWKDISYVGQDFYLEGDSVDAAIVEGKLRSERLAVVKNICQIQKLRKDCIGNNGAEISGGERARIAIARALYKDSSIVIIDEALSSLDLESARYITQKMIAAFTSRRYLIITHREGEIAPKHGIIKIENSVVVSEK